MTIWGTLRNEFQYLEYKEKADFCGGFRHSMVVQRLRKGDTYHKLKDNDAQKKTASK